MKKYFKLFPHCIPVKGAKRSIICNLHEGYYSFITNDLYDILKANSTLNINDLVKDFGEENQNTIEEYLNMLLDSKYLFELIDKDAERYFPKFNLEFDTPSLIDNAIVDVNKKNIIGTVELTKELDELGCHAILFRVIGPVEQQELENLLSPPELSSIEHIDFLISDCKNVSKINFNPLFKQYLRLNSVVIYAAKKKSVKKILTEDGAQIGCIVETNETFNLCQHCPSITPKDFIINPLHFSESINYNNCLNKKITIDVDGNIKNCPSFKNTFANHSDINLKDFVTTNSSFKELWKINKDLISVCQDCEFRYICSDCRSTIGKYQKPLNCNYNPYNASWE